jgi:3'(2'), 5'-bisphosphate nucleotidase
MLNNELINAVLQTVKEAGQAILSVYDEPVELTVKADESPLTQADKASHQLIERQLQQLTPEWPVVSEESDDAAKAKRTTLPIYWLVDPLDGTKEFIKRNGEFTVNIALIVDGVAVFGAVGVPVHNKVYWGGKEYGCSLEDETGIRALSGTTKSDNAALRVVGSRSHVNAETAEYLEKLGKHELVSVGSSLKFCLLAEGKADLYPRLGPTCEWDTAAAQAVLEGAGGKVETLAGQPLRYSKTDILNPWFVASI